MVAMRTLEEIANDVLYKGLEKIGYDIPFPRVTVLAMRIVEAIKLAVADERRRCAQIAEDERVDAEDTQHAADIAYNDACNDIAKKIRRES